MDLIKPVNIQLMYVARAAGESVFRLALLTISHRRGVVFGLPLASARKRWHAGRFSSASS